MSPGNYNYGQKNLLDGNWTLDDWTLATIRFDQLSEAKLFSAVTQDKRNNARFLACRFYRLL